MRGGLGHRSALVRTPPQELSVIVGDPTGALRPTLDSEPCLRLWGRMGGIRAVDGALWRGN